MKTGMYQWLGASLLTIMLITSGCSQLTEKNSTTDVTTKQLQNSNGEIAQSPVQYTTSDLDSSWDASNAEKIEFNDSKVTTSAKRGVFIEGSDVTIALPGTYVLSGQLIDGGVHVKLEGEGEVKLVLNNASIHNEDGAAIYIEDAGKAIITLAEGTSNTLSDGETYQLADGADEPTGTLYSKSDLTINGQGKLLIDANYNNAIVGKDNLLLVDGQYEIQSVDDGIIGRDLLAVKQGSYTLITDGDALKSTNDNEERLGSIYIEGGQFNIEAGADGMDSIGDITIADGSLRINSGGGAEASAIDGNSAKAIKSAGLLLIHNGSFELNSYDDGLHSDNNVEIYGGSFVISAGDDGIHADEALSIHDGVITIRTSYEGLESNEIYVHGGTIELNASDDGVNVAGGNDQSGFMGRGGASFGASENSKLVITGGQLNVNANGDGLDSNGNIEMSGGVVVVNGPEGNGNGALDYDGTFAMTGGTLVAAGSSGMAMAPSAEQSTQASILMYYPATQSAGTLMQLTNSAGDVLVAFSPLKSYQTVVISSPEIEVGESYSLLSGGQSELIEGLGLGQMTPSQLGTELVSFTTKEIVSYVDETGLTTSKSGFGPGGGFGGRGGSGVRGGAGGTTPSGDAARTVPSSDETGTVPSGGADGAGVPTTRGTGGFTDN